VLTITLRSSKERGEALASEGDFTNKSVLTVLTTAVAMALPAQQTPPLRIVGTIALADVEGRIDHFGIDVKGRRLFMSALGNNTVEVFDLSADKRLHTITGLHKPQGVTYAPDSDKIFVANADDGKVRVFDGTTYSQISTLDFGSDADDTRYDSLARRVYVGCGEGGIGVLNSTTGRLLGEIKLEAHPEAFEVEKGGAKIYVNIPDAREIVVADWQRRAIVARWPMEEYRSNFPMALDGRDNRLFVVTRRPTQFLALDALNGRVVAHIPAVGDSDDLWYDATAKRIYVSGGEGFLSVIEQQDADHYRSVAKIPTAAGARTSFFSRELQQLYLAVPRRGNQHAELRTYQVAR
jgi:DNA-binding beta-propeller fold protein YncE